MAFDTLRLRLLAAFTLPLLAVLGALGALAYTLSRNALEDELGQSLASVAAAVASQINTERLATLTPEDTEGEGSRVYRSFMRQLDELRSAAHLRRVVLLDRDGKVRLDAGGALPMGTEMPELLRDRGEFAHALTGENTFSQVLFADEGGRFFKTGYAPLKHDGQVAGAVAIEGSAEFFGPLRQLVQAYVAWVAVALALSVFAALGMARVLSRPLERLSESALRIGRGDLVTQVAPQRMREMNILARELEHMRKALEGREQQLKMMLGGVAHEVRNPLGGMELFAGLLVEELQHAAPNLAEAKSHLARIQHELHHLKRIVEDFLQYAREQKLSVAPFEVQSVLEDCAQRLQKEAAEKQVTVAVKAAPATLEGDSDLLQSAWLNLMKNAVQASKRGGTVHVNGAATEGLYHIDIADEGGGISPELQVKIFEPFFTTREKGTGLGLPLAKKLLEAHRGTLSLESAPGHTVFRCVLPLK
ncbi:MAG: HAMP domain-containing histidine kinase [Myxococcaceae bacterium]|nr:HAMP domain-containing histidine kinase [Myxococcaceae bacterium]